MGYLWHFSPLETFLLRSSLDVLRRVFSAIDIITLINVSRCSKVLHRLFTCYSHATWDPASHYRRWFQDVHDFRRLLRRNNAIISGSFALQFFDRTIYPDSDMDIFMRVAGVENVCEWILSQGYNLQGQNIDYDEDVPQRYGSHFVKAVRNMTSFDNPLLGVYDFQRFVASANGRVEKQRIQVVVVDTDPIEHVLFDFHSTAVMNFLTADDAISIFPVTTFVHRLSYITKTGKDSRERSEEWMRKYEKRGFKVVGPGNRHEGQFIVSGPRYSADSHSWRMTFLPREEDERSRYGPVALGVGFEVLPFESRVVAEGSYLRLAEPFIWRAMRQDSRAGKEWK